MYRQPRFTDTGYLRTVFFHNAVTILCQFEDIILCSNNDRFQRVNTILRIKIRDSNERPVSMTPCHHFQIRVVFYSVS